jgi:hypothetical protein
VGRAIIKDFLRQLLQADLKNLENIICSYRSSFSTDKFVEIVAGFMCERCDNLLANIESEDAFLRALALADRCHRLFLKAHARVRGIEAGACSLEKAEELNEETIAKLRNLLSTGEYKLIAVPKDGYLLLQKILPFRIRFEEIQIYNRIVGETFEDHEKTTEISIWYMIRKSRKLILLFESLGLEVVYPWMNSFAKNLN